MWWRWFWILLLGSGTVQALRATSPVPNSTYSIFNLTVVLETQTSVLPFGLTSQWTSLDTGTVYSLTFPGPLEQNRTYTFELNPLEFQEYSNGSFLWRGNYSWPAFNISRFFVNTECRESVLNYTNQCRRCIANFATESPPCIDCADGYYGALCNQTELECSEQRCSGYGVCIGRTEGCACDNDHFLADCSLNATQCSTQQCNGTGICQPGTVSDCLCRNANYNATDQCRTCRYNYDLSANCTRCIPGYFEDTCTLDAIACAFFRCEDRGVCSGQTEGCTCHPAFTGPLCNESACQGAGVPSANGSRCICDFPNHVDPYNPLRCVLICHPTQGMWIDGVCRCVPGYTGAKCTVKHEPLNPWMVSLLVLIGVVGGVILLYLIRELIFYLRHHHEHDDDDNL